MKGPSWKGKVAYLGLLTIYTFWDDSPSAPCRCFDRGGGFLHLQVADAGGHVRTRLRRWAVDGCRSEDRKVVNRIFEHGYYHKCFQIFIL